MTDLTIVQYPEFIFLGFLTGAYGTLIGAGGGFILMPLLLILYPGVSPENITSISLAAVFFNALSGSFAYARMKRIDYPSGLMFAVATITGAVKGAMHTSHINRRTFDVMLGTVILLVSVFLIIFP